MKKKMICFFVLLLIVGLTAVFISEKLDAISLCL